MIERIVIEYFKSLRKVDLTLGRVNLFVGTNASGKSNFLEALRVLEGIGNGFTIEEILNGKPKSATSEIWEGIRGGSAHVCFSSKDEVRIPRIDTYGVLEKPSPTKWEYRVAFSPESGGVVTDEYINIDIVLYQSGLPATLGGSTSPHPYLAGVLSRTEWRRKSPDLPKRSIQSQWTDALLKLSNSLSNVQHADLKLEVLRSYSRPGLVRRMGGDGENFAALVKTICQNEELKDAYLSWLRHLRPEEVDDVGTAHGALGEPMFMLKENGREFPAPVLSDGTLRFAALAAAFFQPDMPGIMTIEEIENGIHASRVQLLLELFHTQAEVTKTQIFATTHSPAILDWLQEEDYKTTFLCTRDESTGESRIRPLADIPHFMDVIKKTPASELLSEGWFEAVP